MASPDGIRPVPLRWLVLLRWFFLLGQLAVISLALWQSSVSLAWFPLSIALTAYAASNLMLATRLRMPLAASPSGTMGAVLVVDTVLLTVVLAASGGASNPFTVLYLVHITLSAVVLSAGWTAVIAVLAVAGFGTLFLLTPASAHHAGAGFGEHLQGMWAAFIVATALTAFFVSRISQWLAFQREQIATLREASAKNARLAALTTLAAGAAHELNNPLGVIALAAHEAERRSSTTPGAEAITDDLQLIALEVDRCQSILHRMAAQASEREPARTLTMPELAALIQEQLGPDHGKRVELLVDDAIVLPSSELASATIALIRNGLDASELDGKVAVSVATDGDFLRIEVSDHGRGIADDVLAKVGEPFFTTKEPGAGLGLGVFLARALVESRGGTLDIDSAPGQGTRATLVFPSDGGGLENPS